MKAASGSISRENLIADSEIQSNMRTCITNEGGVTCVAVESVRVTANFELGATGLSHINEETL